MIRQRYWIIRDVDEDNIWLVKARNSKAIIEKVHRFTKYNRCWIHDVEFMQVEREPKTWCFQCTGRGVNNEVM